MTATLRRRIFSAGSWTILGYGSNQFLRLFGNLILTRLLFPEAFGLMAIVQAVMSGVALLSDLGVTQSIVQNKNGGSSDFFNTAWTLQILRGGLMWGVLWLIAPTVATFYKEPMLADILPVAGTVAMITSLNSTKIALANRSLGIARITFLDVGSYAFGLAITILWAFIDRSIWSLVAGNIISAIVKMIASHFWLEGERNRLMLHRDALKDLLSLGQWFFVSSALTFLSGEGNRLLIGDLLDVKVLAFFSIAMALDQLPRQVVDQISSKVMFAAYSETLRTQPEGLFKLVAKSRLIQTVPYWLISAIYVYYGPVLVHLLYDPRYSDAAWMLRVMALGSLAGCVSSSYNGILFAKGMVRVSSMLLFVQICLQILAMFLGAYFWGARGLVIALASVSWVMYPVNAFCYSRIGLWQPRLDIPILVASMLVVSSVQIM
ncbi:MAG: oligosaccharide flippase family protein [Proteobacteria bacterium]|nr:oligosaccharide flippase family protein [Pseudomonadota bacterium]HQR03423.1 oligosaccharide flippase family protein [Rhodocyclaceae bacterium]